MITFFLFIFSFFLTLKNKNKLINKIFVITDYASPVPINVYTTSRLGYAVLIHQNIKNCLIWKINLDFWKNFFLFSWRFLFYRSLLQNICFWKKKCYIILLKCKDKSLETWGDCRWAIYGYVSCPAIDSLHNPFFSYMILCIVSYYHIT